MKKPRRKPGYRLEVLDNEILLFNPADTLLIYCNETASLVWQLCNGENSSEEIIDLLIAAYPEAADQIPDDVESVLQELVEHGAIEFA